MDGCYFLFLCHNGEDWSCLRTSEVLLLVNTSPLKGIRPSPRSLVSLFQQCTMLKFAKQGTVKNLSGCGWTRKILKVGANCGKSIHRPASWPGTLWGNAFNKYDMPHTKTKDDLTTEKKNKKEQLIFAKEISRSLTICLQMVKWTPSQQVSMVEDP